MFLPVEMLDTSETFIKGSAAAPTEEKVGTNHMHPHKQFDNIPGAEDPFTTCIDDDGCSTALLQNPEVKTAQLSSTAFGNWDRDTRLPYRLGWPRALELDHRDEILDHELPHDTQIRNVNSSNHPPTPLSKVLPCSVAAAKDLG
jgi:hypothetical protein